MPTKDLKRPKAELAKENRAIGKRLRAAREGMHLSQRQVALVLGENQSWVSKIEKGERRADLAEGTRMMRLYRVEANAILMPEGLPKPLSKAALGLSLVADAPAARGRGGKVHRPKYRGAGRRSLRLVASRSEAPRSGSKPRRKPRRSKA